MKHKPKKYFLSGIIPDDSQLISRRSASEYWLIKEMREAGFVPMLDQEPIWKTLKRKDNSYTFELSIYAVYVGKDNSWTIEGMDATGKMLPRIPPTKLNTS